MKEIIAKIEKETENLIAFISRFDRKVSIPIAIFILRLDRSTSNRYLQLKSPVKQIGYMISLCLFSKGIEIMSDADFSEVCYSLQRIEDLYIQIQEDKSILEYYNEEYRKEITTASFYGSYYFNTDLIYPEQVIDRIKETFRSVENIIIQKTGLSINDFIDFYLETYSLSYSKSQKTAQSFFKQQYAQTKRGFYFYGNNNERQFMPLELPLNLTINKEEYKSVDKNKIIKLLDIFSISKLSQDQPHYYGDNQVVQTKPFIKLDEANFIIYYDYQLLIAIYEFLLSLFSQEKISRLKAANLESKTRKIFEQFFSKKSIVHSNYYINNSDHEKDLLILIDKYAFIVECKSDKMQEPFRCKEKGFIRLKRNFSSTIQKGYEQALEVETAFYNMPIIKICDKNKNVINTIQTKKYDRVFSIIVTQERYGLVQIDLGLLLSKNKDLFYPWSVCIDDLETILLTMARKKNALYYLTQYLVAREKLNKRVVSHDELDLAAYYILQKQKFIYASSSESVFITQLDNCFFFDDLYRYGGLGFDEELFLDRKFNISFSAWLTYNLCKKLHLRYSAKAIKYKKENRINDDAIILFDKIIANPTITNKIFIRLIANNQFEREEFMNKYYQFISSCQDSTDISSFFKE